MISNPRFYPRWEQVPGEDSPRLIHDHLTHSALLGIEFDRDANPVVKTEEPAKVPPTLEEVIAAGYSKEVAEKIVDEEQYKFKAGMKPYGDLEPEPVIPSGPGVVVQPLSAEEEDLAAMFMRKKE